MSPAPAEKPHRYIESASDEEVLDDQFCWLRVHREMCQVAGCEHCRRMDRLKEILMQPFREEKYYSIQISKKRAKGAGK